MRRRLVDVLLLRRVSSERLAWFLGLLMVNLALPLDGWRLVLFNLGLVTYVTASILGWDRVKANVAADALAARQAQWARDEAKLPPRPE